MAAFPPKKPASAPGGSGSGSSAKKGNALVSNKPAPKALPNTGTAPAKAGGAQPAPAKKTAVPVTAAAPAPGGAAAKKPAGTAAGASPGAKKPGTTTSGARRSAGGKSASPATPTRTRARNASPKKPGMGAAAPSGSGGESASAAAAGGNANGTTISDQSAGQQPGQQAAPPQHVHNIRVHIHSGTNAGPSQQPSQPPQPQQLPQQPQQDDGSGAADMMGGGQPQDGQPQAQGQGAQNSKPGFDPASNPTFGPGTSGIQQPGNTPMQAAQRRGAPQGSPQGQGAGAFNDGGRPLGLQSRNGASQGSMNAAGQATTRKKKLPVKPRKAPPEPADVANARARQSSVLKQRQAREMRGKVAGPYRDADAGAGAWPFLGTLM